MTLSVIRYHCNNNLSEEYIHCGADGRITNHNECLTNSAIKIFPLQISLSPTACYDHKVPQRSYEIGFTYAGHVGVSLYTYSLLSYFCKRIEIIESIPYSAFSFPAIKNISQLTAFILNNYIKDYGFIQGPASQSEIILFGFCSQLKDFVAYHIYPEVIPTNELKIKVENIDIKNIPFFAIGSGKKLLNEKIKQNNNIFSPKLIRKIIEEQQQDSSVGGFYQRAVCHKNHFTLYNESPLRDSEMKLLGKFPMIYPLGTHFVSLTSTLRLDYD